MNNNLKENIGVHAKLLLHYFLNFYQIYFFNCNKEIFNGAASGNRIHDLFITNEVHYHCAIAAEMVAKEGLEPPTSGL